MPAPRRYLASAAALLLLGVAAWYAWVPASFHARWLTTHPTDYNHELTDALLAGQLHLARVPDLRLVTLPDPYDPAANAVYRINDLSYYRGRYYLYHSAVPALTVFAPVKLLTGRYLSPAAAVWVFCVIGAGASLALLLGLRERLAPRCPTPVVAGAALALTCAQGAHVVLRDGMLNQVPIAAAYGFLMLGLLALWRARPEARHPAAWLVLGSLALGLAIASRPNYLFAVALALLVVVFARWRQAGGRWSGRLVRDLLAAGLPVGCLVTGLLVYNYARFGDPREFGMRYMLGGWDQRALPTLAWGNFAENAYHYLLAPGVYSLSFPFVTAPSWQAIGLLLHAPFVWLALLLPVVLRSKDDAARTFCLTLLGVWLANFTLLLFLPSGNNAAVLTSANARYLLDFQPALMLLAAAGALATGHALAERAWSRRLFTGGGLLLALVSVCAALSLDLARYPLESYRGLARGLSQPAWWWERWQGLDYGPIALEMIFPSDKNGAYEPLVTTGTATGGDLVYVHYESPRSVRFGLVGVGVAGPLSDSIPVDYAQPHRLELHLGSLNPRISHPRLAGSDAAQIAALKRRLIVRLDGRTVFTTAAFFHVATPQSVDVGHAGFLRDYTAERFTGRILRQERLPLALPDGFVPVPEAYGALQLRLLFPTERRERVEPLLSTGIPQAGDVFFVTYRADGAIRLGLDHWGHPSLLSDWLSLDPAAETVVEISAGALLPVENHALLALQPPAHRQAMKERVLISLNGRIVLDAVQPTYDSSPYDVVAGRNTIGASSTVYAFSGRVLDVTRVPLPAPPP